MGKLYAIDRCYRPVEAIAFTGTKSNNKKDKKNFVILAGIRIPCCVRSLLQFEKYQRKNEETARRT